MAKLDVKGLVIKRRGRKTYCYWQPNAGERKAGWEPLALGSDAIRAAAACEAQNAKVEEWRNGGAKPRQVAKFVKRGTLDQLIAAYRASEFPRLSHDTRKTYNTALDWLSRWGGSEDVTHITRARTRKLREMLLKPDRLTGEVMLTRAKTIVSRGTALFNFGIREGHLPEGALNPFAELRMPTPPPRDQIWSPEAVDLFLALDGVAAQPGLALAVLLAREIGQREGDLLKLSIGQWVEIPRFKLDPHDWDRMAEPEPDGTLSVRAMRIRQGKTRRWIEVPVVGPTRRLVEAAIARSKAAGSTLLLLEHVGFDARGRHTAPQGEATDIWTRWTATRFQRAIAELRDAAAAAAAKAGDAALTAEIADLQFRDLRRTAVVWLGELGIEDHLIAAITGHTLDQTRKILETYLPRTTKMAGRAIALRIERTGDTGRPAQKVKLTPNA